MKLKFLKAHFGVEYKIPENFFEKVEEVFGTEANILVFSSVQFRPKIPEMISLLEERGYTSQTSKALRTSLEGQILGCDSYADSLGVDLSEIDGFIYIGDGYFHPNALLLAQEYEEKIKPVLILNAVQELIEVIDESHISKYLKKKKGVLTKFHVSKTIGVFVTTKWGQEYKTSALKLKEMYPDKEFYFFIGDNFLDIEIENFPWVECFVNTACPRIGQDDILRHKKAVVNIKDIWKN